MSRAFFQDGIECPECGITTHELHKATSSSNGEKVLMCEDCLDISEEDMDEWWENDFLDVDIKE